MKLEQIWKTVKKTNYVRGSIAKLQIKNKDGTLINV